MTCCADYRHYVGQTFINPEGAIELVDYIAMAPSHLGNRSFFLSHYIEHRNLDPDQAISLSYSGSFDIVLITKTANGSGGYTFSCKDLDIFLSEHNLPAA